MTEVQRRMRGSLAWKLKWYAIAALAAGTIIPKTGPDQGVIVGHVRHYMGDVDSDYYEETYRLTEAGWFNTGHSNYRLHEHGSGFSSGEPWLPGCLWGWAPMVVASLLLGRAVRSGENRTSFVQLLRYRRTWVLFGATWIGSQMWLAYGALGMLATEHGEVVTGCGLLLFLGLNGAILLFAMDGRRTHFSSALFWHVLRGWSQSYVVYLTVVALLLWRQESWPFFGLPLAAAGAVLTWVYTDHRIQQLRQEAAA